MQRLARTSGRYVFALLGCCALLILPACNRNNDNNAQDVAAGQSARDGSLDASTMDALTSAQEPAMDVTEAMAAEQNAKPTASAAPASAIPASKDAKQ